MSEMDLDRPLFVRVIQWALAATLLGAAASSFRSAVVPTGVGLSILWMALFTSPLGGTLMRLIRLQIGAWARFALTWVPPVLAIMVLVRLDTSPPSPSNHVQDVASASHRDESSNDAASAMFVKKMLAGQLVDPQSARLTNVIAYRDGNKLTFCGNANAKNRLGGYAGATPFVVSDSGVFVGDAATSQRIFDECHGSEVTPVPDE